MTKEEAIKSALKFLVRKQQEQGSWGYADNDNANEVSWNEIIRWIDQQTCGDCISRETAEKKLNKIVDEMELIFADIREKNVDDSVCGLCEYDCDHGIDGYANECPGFERNDCFKLKEEYQKEWTDLSDIPSVEPERKPGKWEWDQRTGEYVCSECGCNPIYERTTPDVSEIDKYRFCRWCGAPMEVEADHS